MMYKSGWSYERVRSMYPVMNKTEWYYVRFNTHGRCKCMDGTEFENRKKRNLYYPEVEHTKQSFKSYMILAIVVFICLKIVIVVVAVVCCKKKKCNKIGTIGQNNAEPNM